MTNSTPPGPAPLHHRPPTFHELLSSKDFARRGPRYAVGPPLALGLLAVVDSPAQRLYGSFRKTRFKLKHSSKPNGGNHGLEEKVGEEIEESAPKAS